MTRFALLALLALSAQASPVRLAIAGYPDPVASSSDRMPARLETGHLFILLDDARWVPRDDDEDERIPTARTHHPLYYELVVPMKATTVTRRGLKVSVGDRWTIHDGRSPFTVAITELVRFVGDVEHGDDPGYDEVFAVAKLPAGRGPDPPDDPPTFCLAAPERDSPPLPLHPLTPAPRVDRAAWAEELLDAVELYDGTQVLQRDLHVRPLSLGETEAHLAVLNLPVKDCWSDYGCTQPSQLRVLSPTGKLLHEEEALRDPTIVVVGDVDGDGSHDILASSCRSGCSFTILTWSDGGFEVTRWEMESGC